MQLPLAESWQEARHRFLDAAERHGAELFTLPIGSDQSRRETMVMDIAWIGRRDASRVLVHVSGVHGVEGFAGSYVQCSLMEHLDTDETSHTAFVFVHGVNPFGMIHGRRWNEKNVDLNRNFLTGGACYRGVAPLYERLVSLLVPQPDSRHLTFWGFTWRMLWVASRYGLQRTAQAIAGGQYEYPTGLFFGGRELQVGPRQLLDWCRRHLADRQLVGVLDQHTGLGRYGQPTVFPSSRAPTDAPCRAVNSATWNTPYQARGDLTASLQQEVPPCRGYTWTMEVGTYPMLYLLYLLREENLSWHRPEEVPQRDVWRRRLRRAFCPPCANWLRSLQRHGTAVWRQCLQIISEATVA